MASVFPTGLYYTKSGALSDNNLTTVYTCADQQEVQTLITGITVADTTGNADTCTVKRYQSVGTTDYTLIYQGAVEVGFPLQIEGLPIVLNTGDALKLQATAGATHTLHYHITFHKVVRAPEGKS